MSHAASVQRGRLGSASLEDVLGERHVRLPHFLFSRALDFDTQRTHTQMKERT